MIDHREAYQFNEAHYKVAMEAADVGMWDWDLLQNRQVWSKECKAILGVPPDAEENFAHFLSLIHPEDKERIQTHLAKSHSARIPHNIEYRVIWPDGSLHWISDRGRFLYDEQGRAVRLVGVVIDITAQRKAEEERQKVDQHMREILESIGEAFAHLDQDWRYTYMNSRAIHMQGYHSEEEVLGKTLWEMHPDLVGNIVEDYFRRAMEKRQPVSFEAYDAVMQRWDDVRIYPAERGGITIFRTDITARRLLEQERDRLFARERAARKEAEEAHRQSDELVKQLEEQQAFLQAIMQQAPSGLVIATAPLGKIISSNEEALKLLGNSGLESQAYPHYARFGALHADGTPYSAEEYPLARAILTGEVIKQEYMLFQRHDGHLIHIAINATPIYDARGEIIAGVATFHDISEHYELEQKKDEFIRLASHELRTPLTSLKGNLQLAERRFRRLLKCGEHPLTEEDRTLLEHLAIWNERALRQANVEERLINDLLDASDLQMKELRVVLKAGNLAQIVRNAIEDIQTMAPPDALRFEAPDLSEIPVMIDEVRIGQVVTHFVKNALKYTTNHQSITISIQAENNEARVRVKDSGPGISADAQRYIWERFRQASGFTGYKGINGSGLGLGLYICQELIRLHGGQTGVESAPGQGSTFWFTLPLLEKQG